MATFIVERLFARFSGILKFVTSWGEKVEIKDIWKEIRDLKEDDEKLGEFIESFSIEDIEKIDKNTTEESQKLEKHAVALLLRDFLALDNVIKVFNKGTYEARRLIDKLNALKKEEDETVKEELEKLIKKLNGKIEEDRKDVIKKDYAKFNKVLHKTIALINSLEEYKKEIEEGKKPEKNFVSELTTFMKDKTADSFFSYIKQKAERNEVLRELGREKDKQKKIKEIIKRVNEIIDKHKETVKIDVLKEDVEKFIDDYANMADENMKAISAGIMLALRNIIILFALYEILLDITRKNEEAKKNFIIPTVMETEVIKGISELLKGAEDDLKEIYKGEETDIRGVRAAD